MRIRQWIADWLGLYPERVRVTVLATFTREKENGCVLQSRIIEVAPPSYDADIRVELRACSDSFDGWYPIAELRLADASAFASLLTDADEFAKVYPKEVFNC